MNVPTTPKRSEVPALLRANLVLATSSARPGEALFESAFAVYRRLVGSGCAHLPFFLVLDLRHLIEDGHDFPLTDASELSESHRATRTRYQNAFINRFLRERGFNDLLDTLSYYRVHHDKSPEFAYFPRAEHLCELISARVAAHWPARWAVNAAHIRAESEQLFRGSEEDLREPCGELFEDLSLFVDRVNGLNHDEPFHWSELLRPEDTVELQHLHVLNRAYLRRQVREVYGLAASLPAIQVSRYTLKEENSESETKFLDNTHYPMGGFSELSNRGSFENLMFSELIYMGEGDESGVDLFDVRFVENELLFYARDHGQLRRKRRTIVFVVDMRAPLDIKFPEHRYQLVTLVIALLLRLVEDLDTLFENDSVSFGVHLLSRDSEATATWREVLHLLWQPLIQHNRMEIVDAEDVDLSKVGQSHRKTYALCLSADRRATEVWSRAFADAATWRPPLQGLVVDLAGEGHSSQTMVALSPGEGALEHLREQLLLWTVGQAFHLPASLDAPEDE